MYNLSDGQIYLFRKQIAYKGSWRDILAFVDSSISCRQFTRIDCYHALIYEKQEAFSFVVDRNGASMTYIGGGPENGKGTKEQYGYFIYIKTTCAKNEKAGRDVGCAQCTAIFHCILLIAAYVA